MKNNRLKTKQKEAVCLLLALLLTLSLAVPANTVKSYAAAEAGNVYLKQATSVTCTLCSATMMLRQRAKNAGREGWTRITEAAVRPVAWQNGLSHNFTYAGMTVKNAKVTGNHKTFLLNNLKNHPEGFVIYMRNPHHHAVFLTRYDASSDTFYVADPANSTVAGKEIPLASCTLSKYASGQGNIVNHIADVWVITKDNGTSIPIATADYGFAGSDSGGMGSSSYSSYDIIHGVSQNFNLDEILAEFQENYGWDPAKILTLKWTEKDGKKKKEYKRLAGYQTDFWLDNLETTQKYIGLDALMVGTSISSVQSFINAVMAEYNAGFAPTGSTPDINKYSEWFAGKGKGCVWDTVFIAYCAEQAGLLSGGTFTKTASAQTMYSYLKGKGNSSYAVIDTTIYGGSYAPQAGDILFCSKDGTEGGINHAGVVVSVTSDGFYVVEGDYNDGLAKNFYNNETLSSQGFDYVRNGFLVNVQYPTGGFGGTITEGDMDTNAKTIYQFARTTLGMTRAAACGLLGNIEQECHFNPRDGSGKVIGITQWTGSRFTVLVNFCQSHGYDYKTLTGQLYMLQDEAHGSYKNVFMKMNAVADSEDGAVKAAEIFEKGYEKAGKPMMDNRRKYARKWWNTSQAWG